MRKNYDIKKNKKHFIAKGKVKKPCGRRLQKLKFQNLQAKLKKDF